MLYLIGGYLAYLNHVTGEVTTYSGLWRGRRGKHKGGLTKNVLWESFLLEKGGPLWVGF